MSEGIIVSHEVFEKGFSQEAHQAYKEEIAKSAIDEVYGQVNLLGNETPLEIARALVTACKSVRGPSLAV